MKDSSVSSRTIEWLRFFCVVAVPIFFFISGYLFFKGLEEWNTSVWIGKLKKRVRTLLVPYLVWNLLSILVQFLSDNKAALLEGMPPNIGVWFQTIGGWRVLWGTGHLGLPHNAPLWFIRNLMLLAVFAPVIFYSLRNLVRLACLP